MVTTEDTERKEKLLLWGGGWGSLGGGGGDRGKEGVGEPVGRGLVERGRWTSFFDTANKSGKFYILGFLNNSLEDTNPENLVCYVSTWM